MGSKPRNPIERKNSEDSSDRSDALPGQKDGGSSPRQAVPRPISERRLRANRLNALRSTGPRTAAGKARSRSNAVRHGLLSETLLFTSASMAANQEVQKVYETLQRQYGGEDAEATVRSVVVELAHQRRVTELEESCLQSLRNGSSTPVSLEHLHRYRTTSQRALLKHLEQLRRRPGQRSDEQTRKPDDRSDSTESNVQSKKEADFLRNELNS